MSDLASTDSVYRSPVDAKHPSTGKLAFFVVLLLGLAYVAYGFMSDLNAAHQAPLAIGTLVLLGIALLIALGFEFVNGFHDTANAVATVIYTRSLAPPVAVVWSGVFNFLGVLTSTGAVAYSIITLLPIDLILNAGSQSGYAMIFALLIAAIVWNLLTWSMGIPNSSSHALIGSILGVGLANQLMTPAGVASASVPWNQVWKVAQALLFSPLLGFGAAAVLLVVMKAVIRDKRLYDAPGDTPPPAWIRGLLVLTCTGVSFAHGSNDGQKGMGLIMLILIGAAPTAFALNRAMPDASMPAFVLAAQHATPIFDAHAAHAANTDIQKARAVVNEALKTKALNTPEVFAGLAVISNEIVHDVQSYGTIKQVPAAAVPNMRNDMYLTEEAIAGLPKSGAAFTAQDLDALKAYGKVLQNGTRYIPTWVKVAVALALGLGTMVGWKRIVVTVGEKIGKDHLTYAQGASAELVAMGTIGLADAYGLPVSTTHVLSSGVAGTMAANGSGLQWSTLRNMVLAWVLTLPAAITLAGSLFWLLRHLGG